MEIILVCVFVLVWAMVTLYESEKREPCSQKTSVASPATAYPKPDVKSGNPLPDAESADPVIRFHRCKCSALSTIPENNEGEDHIAEIEKLAAELKKAKSEMWQQQQATQKDMEQLQHQVTDLMVEKEVLAEQLVQDEIRTNKAIQIVTTCYENRMKKLRKELAAATKTVKPITKDVGCGSDAMKVAVASTQTTESIAKEVGCGTKEHHPAQIRTNQQEVCKEELCGFQLDFKMMEQFTERQRPFYIPARDKTKSPVLADPKPEINFSAVRDIRYKNKPMSGYVVNSDGSTVTYGDAAKSTPKPAAAIPTKMTETAGPPVSEQSKETIGLVKTDDLIVTTTPVERVSLPGNKLLLKNIPGGDYGRIIGSGGSNIRRIETEYRIVAGINKSPNEDLSFLITGNNEEMRQAAADDIIRGLTITAEFVNLKLSKRIRNVRLFEIGKKFFVRINRPSPSDSNGKMTLTGKLTSCQSAYAELLAEIIH